MLQGKVVLGPITAFFATDLIDIIGRPDELVHIATAVARDSMDIVLREGAPI